MKLARAAALTALCCAAAACDLAPLYHRPPVATPPAFKEAGQNWVPATGNKTVSNEKWWLMFGDPVLNGLEDKVNAQNQSLKAALARYDQARAAAAVAGAAVFPIVTGSAGGVREKDSGNTRQHLSTAQYSDYSAGLNLSYTIDVWGRVRNAVAAAGDQATATADDAAAIRLDLQAQMAAGYFTLRGEDFEIDILTKTVQNYQSELVLTQRRHDGGVATAADVDQAEQQVDSAKGQLEATRLRRQQQEHALAILAGEAPANFTVAAAPLNFVVLPVNPGTPSTLLERRPDIASAERLVAAANAEVGVARAAYFPEFDLTGALGLESETLGKLLEAPSLFWSLGPTASLTVFDVGQISGLAAEARAAYDEAVANYRQAVLSAYQDVEDNIAAMRQLALEAQSDQAAAAAADRALQQSYDRYQGGITTSLDLAVQENLDLQAKITLADTQIAHMTANVRLMEAIGGGWNPAAKP